MQAAPGACRSDHGGGGGSARSTVSAVFGVVACAVMGLARYALKLVLARERYLARVQHYKTQEVFEVLELANKYSGSRFSVRARRAAAARV